MPPPKLFICYSRQDKRWFDQLFRHLQALRQQRKLAPWTDQEIPVGAVWREEIEKALKEADIAVLLVTPSFFASGFIHDVELPELMQKRVVWVAVETSLYKHTPIAALQCANNPGRPLSRIRGDYLNEAWVNVCDKILTVVAELPGSPENPAPERPNPIEIGSEGREMETPVAPPPRNAEKSVLPEIITPPKNADMEGEESFSTADFTKIKKQGLRKRLEFLQKQWIAENDALMVSLDAAARVAIRERLEQLEREQAEIEAVLSGQEGKRDEEASSPRELELDPFSVRGSTRSNPVNGSEMVWIPAGAFQMGGDKYPDERPIHRVSLDGFWMQRTPVTVRQYEAFVSAKRFAGEQIAGHIAEMPAPPDFNLGWKFKDHPMVNVTWHEAEAYCVWAKVRLPTEAEWEYASRGGLEGNEYWWGDVWDGSKCTNSAGKSRLSGTQSVRNNPANGYGLRDMFGNVWEWCADWYDAEYYQSSSSDNPKGAADGIRRVVRGGSWDATNQYFFRCACRSNDAPNNRDFDLGFRCCFSGL